MYYRAVLNLIFSSKPLEKSSQSFPLHAPSEIENFSTEEGVLASFRQSPPEVILQSFVMGKFGALKFRMLITCVMHVSGYA